MNIEIKKILPKDTLYLREKILRPGQSLDRLVYSGDYDKKAYHVGAFSNNEIIGIASVYPKPKDNEDRSDSWQLRGMAVLDTFRGHDIGKKLLGDCINNIKNSGDKHLWCNARTSAIKFYQKMGFKITSQEFLIPDIGPHYIMEIEIN